MNEKDRTLSIDDVAAAFVQEIVRSGRAVVNPEHLGFVLVSFPVVGGGLDCVVLRVHDMIVRLTLQGFGNWVAEEIVVRRAWS